MFSKAGVWPEGGSVLFGAKFIDFAGFFFGFFLVCFLSLIGYFTGHFVGYFEWLVLSQGSLSVL